MPCSCIALSCLNPRKSIIIPYTVCIISCTVWGKSKIIPYTVWGKARKKNY
jgi:hypothetical protein